MKEVQLSYIGLLEATQLRVWWQESCEIYPHKNHSHITTIAAPPLLPYFHYYRITAARCMRA